ncbi:MAG: glycoside hydrolase family 3 N-terminal domain-containing protein, partial [Oscillospiraceae bacterium]
DSTMPICERVDDLLSRMTLKEKVGQLNQKMYGWQALINIGGNFSPSEKFKEEVSVGDGLGALYGLFRADPWSGVNCSNAVNLSDNPKVANTLQRYVLENTRLAVPIMFSEECPHGHQAIDSTILPTSIGIGATFNPELYEKAFAKVSAQMRARGATLALISCLDIAQDPRWGRTEECYGEDPVLSQIFSEAVVYGLQGKTSEELASERHLGAVVKHFCAQGAAVGGHNGKHTVIGEREMREIHLPPMQGAIRAKAVSCMAAYNDIDGVYCHANRHLLTDILRDEMNFQGFIMSDGCAIDILQNVTGWGNYEKSAKLAIEAGVDLNLWSVSYTKLEKAVNDGTIKETYIDKAASRVLTAKFKLGLFEHPYTNEKIDISLFKDKETNDLNLELARQSVVLLKNDGILPLDGNYKKIAVIGPNADNIYNQLGDYTPEQRKGKGYTVIKGIKECFKNSEIIYAKGCDIRGNDTDGFEKAILAASKADVVIMVVGSSSARESGDCENKTGAAVAANLKNMNCGEGADKADLRLEPIQRELIEEISKTGKPMVTVLIAGRPCTMEGLLKHSNAVLNAWYPGEMGGLAIAEIIKGSVNPSGRLSISIPYSSAQLPVYYNYKSVDDYVDKSGTAEFPFGYGLSYTEFSYGDIKLSADIVSLDDLKNCIDIKAYVEIKNIGARDGFETVQLYIHDMESSVTRRNRELKAFRKIFLKSGESRVVEFGLSKDMFEVFSSNNIMEIETGYSEIYIGRNCRSSEKAILKITD